MLFDDDCVTSDCVILSTVAGYSSRSPPILKLPVTPFLPYAHSSTFRVLLSAHYVDKIRILATRPRISVFAHACVYLCMCVDLCTCTHTCRTCATFRRKVDRLLGNFCDGLCTLQLRCHAGPLRTVHRSEVTALQHPPPLEIRKFL